MKTSRVLITGGAGYIGSHVVRQMLDAGHEVSVIDNLSTGVRWTVPDEVKFHEKDLANEAAIDEILREGRFDAIVHIAGNALVDESVELPMKYYKNNTANSLKLFDLAIRNGVRSIIFSSTSTVYGESSGTLLHEDATLSPISPYGWSKLMCERILRDAAFASRDVLRFVILRYFNVSGARADLSLGPMSSNATRLIKVAAECAVGARKGMSIYGTDYPTTDGTCERDYVHVEDIAHAHFESLRYLADGGRSETLNVGYGRATSVRSVIEAMKKVSGVDFPVSELGRRPGDPAVLAADCEKIRRVLGWKPSHDDLHDMCRSAYRWELKLIERSRSLDSHS